VQQAPANPSASRKLVPAVFDASNGPLAGRAPGQAWPALLDEQNRARACRSIDRQRQRDNAIPLRHGRPRSPSGFVPNLAPRAMARSAVDP